VKGVSAVHNESDLKEPVRLVVDLKRDADPEIVLNQLYQYTQLQDTFSVIFLALVDGKPRVMPFKSMIEEFIRHRRIVIREQRKVQKPDGQSSTDWLFARDPISKNAHPSLPNITIP
jgi:DNA gyrase/topoisomerase IV subunit A